MMRRPFRQLCGILCLSLSVSVLPALTDPEIAGIVAGNTPEQACTKLESALRTTEKNTEKRLICSTLAQIFERRGLFADAEKYYLEAAALSAANSVPAAPDLLLNAAVCILSRGDWAAADELLAKIAAVADPAVYTPKIKLYAVWSWLCKIESEKNLFEPVVILQSYLKQPDMKPVYPSILCTLWYLTADAAYADTLKTQFPDAPETAVALGKAALYPAPFWYFIPHKAETTLP